MESKQDFSTWIKARIDKYGFVENIDFVTLHKKVERQVLIEYFISLDMAKELSMIENNAQGKAARRYFIECEKIAKGEAPKVEAEPAVEEAVVEDDVVENAAPVAVSVFNFESHNVRTVVDDNGVIWFVAKDVADILGYSDAQAMTRRLDGDEFKKANLQNVGLHNNQSLINESGFYSAVLGSTKPETKRFKKWVTSEVLPTIRKTGKYEAPKVEPRQDDSLLEKLMTNNAIIKEALCGFNMLGIEGNQAALGANKLASNANDLDSASS